MTGVKRVSEFRQSPVPEATGEARCQCGGVAVRDGYCADCAGRLREELIGALDDVDRLRIQRRDRAMPFRFSDEVVGQVEVDGAPRVVYVAVACPVCSARCARPKVLYSRLGTPRKHTDFYNEYPVLDSTRYEITVCPNCGFAASEGGWAILGAWIGQDLNHRDWGLTTAFDAGRSDAQAIMAFRLALYFAAHSPRQRLNMQGRLHLRLAWLHRRAGRGPEEQAALEKALAALEQSYGEERLSDVAAAAQQQYLIGEIYLRLGHPAEAAGWFRRLVFEQREEPVKATSRLAKRRLTEALQAHRDGFDPVRIPWIFE